MAEFLGGFLQQFGDTLTKQGLLEQKSKIDSNNWLKKQAFKFEQDKEMAKYKHGLKGLGGGGKTTFSLDDL